MTGVVFARHITRQLCAFGFSAEGAIRIRVGRKGQESIVQEDVDLIEQRMQLIIHMTFRLVRVEVRSATSLQASLARYLAACLMF